jgi:hypothetical protein
MQRIPVIERIVVCMGAVIVKKLGGGRGGIWELRESPLIAAPVLNAPVPVIIEPVPVLMIALFV